MSNLSHWDFAETLNGFDAASLILGLDPITDDCSAILPIVCRMRESYISTLNAIRDDCILRETYLSSNGELLIFTKERSIIRQMVNSNLEHLKNPTHLYSYRMNGAFNELENVVLYKDALWEMAEERFNRWCFDDEATKFEYQLFEKYEIHVWINEIGLTSIYNFNHNKKNLDKYSIQTSRNIHLIPRRRDLLKPVIELAQSQCRDQWDVAEVWAKLRVLASAKHSPLIGIDEVGIQYIDEKDEHCCLKLKSLRMRLNRARET